MLTSDTELASKQHGVPAIFILCEKCFWCASFMDKTRVPSEKCPVCFATVLSSFPVMPDESFIFNHDEKRGVEFDFRRRK